MRRIGVLMPGDENDSLEKMFVSAFAQALAGLRWTDGRNVRMDLRWFGDDINRMRALAQELVDLQPEVRTSHFNVKIAHLPGKLVGCQVQISPSRPEPPQ